jgi:hypothetical protein
MADPTVHLYVKRRWYFLPLAWLGYLVGHLLLGIEAEKVVRWAARIGLKIGVANG